MRLDKLKTYKSKVKGHEDEEYYKYEEMAEKINELVEKVNQLNHEVLGDDTYMD